jgi:hypothetical protein
MREETGRDEDRSTSNKEEIVKIESILIDGDDPSIRE